MSENNEFVFKRFLRSPIKISKNGIFIDKTLIKFNEIISMSRYIQGDLVRYWIKTKTKTINIAKPIFYEDFEQMIVSDANLIEEQGIYGIAGTDGGEYLTKRWHRNGEKFVYSSFVEHLFDHDFKK